MADDDPRHEQLHLSLRDGDDTTALSIATGGVDVNGEWNSVTHLYAASCTASIHIILVLVVKKMKQKFVISYNIYCLPGTSIIIFQYFNAGGD